VRIIHPAHPLREQSFPVLHQGGEKGNQLLKIQLPDGECRFIPLDWTDQASSTVHRPGARFLIANLLTLRQRLNALLPKSIESGTIPPENETPITGGNYGQPASFPLATSVGGPTEAGHRYPGADVVAPLGAATKGG